MKTGGFGRVEDYSEIRNAGYDFAELDIPEIEGLSEEAFDRFCKEVEAGQFRVLTGARLLPAAEPLFFTDGFSPVQLVPYLKRACRRTARLGIEKVILGNGKARSFIREEDRKRQRVFIESLRLMAEIAGEYGQEVIVEPLGPEYSNYIHTIPEAVQVLQQVHMPNLFTMADLRHMVGAAEDFEDLSEYAFYIHHVHVDYPLSRPERRYPQAGDGYDYDRFFEALQRAGYDGTLTIEADIPQDWSEAYAKLPKIIKGLK